MCHEMNAPAAAILSLVLGRTQFMGSKFGIFGGFGWVRSLISAVEPGFGRVRNSVFPDLGLGSTYIWPNRFEVRIFYRSSTWIRSNPIKHVL